LRVLVPQADGEHAAQVLRETLANFFVYTVRYGTLSWGPTFLKEAKGRGKKFVLLGLTHGVREVLQLTRLTGVFEIRGSEDDL